MIKNIKVGMRVKVSDTLGLEGFFLRGRIGEVVSIIGTTMVKVSIEVKGENKSEVFKLFVEDLEAINRGERELYNAKLRDRIKEELGRIEEYIIEVQLNRHWADEDGEGTTDLMVVIHKGEEMWEDFEDIQIQRAEDDMEMNVAIEKYIKNEAKKLHKYLTENFHNVQAEISQADC